MHNRVLSLFLWHEAVKQAGVTLALRSAEVRLTLDGQVFLDQLDILLFGQQGGQSPNQQVDLHRSAPVLHDVEPSLVRLTQRQLGKDAKHTDNVKLTQDSEE